MAGKRKSKVPKGHSGKRKTPTLKRFGNNANVKNHKPILSKWASGSKMVRSAAHVTLRAFNLPTYTDEELEFFEDSWANTPAGTALDKRIELVIGGGVKPVFELIDPTKSNGEEMSEDDQKEAPTANELNLLDEVVNLNLKDALDIIEEAMAQEIPEEPKEEERE